MTLEEPKVVGRERLEPSARIFEVFRNAGYSLPAAIADLVDNSIDAKAKIILVRFLLDNEEIRKLQVLDNGYGMTDGEATEAMRFGSETEYEDEALGMYGVGLKSASLSSADSLTIVSRKKNGGQLVGRRWTAEGASDDWMCDTLDRDWCEKLVNSVEGSEIKFSRGGTIIEWDKVHDFAKSKVSGPDAYLKRITKDLNLHLGLHFHRIIEKDMSRIFVDSYNLETDTLGPIHEIQPIDPFKYPKSGKRGYPKKFQLEDPELGKLDMEAHIWPKLEKQPPEYKLDGVNARQGLYFYRNDRLLHGGGWVGYREEESHQSLARVVIDLPKKWEGLIRVTFNKSGVNAPVSFTQALSVAEAENGKVFTEFVSDAVEVYRTKKEAKLTKQIPPGHGIPAPVRDRILKNIPTHDVAGVSIEWGRMPKKFFFVVNQSPVNPTITINSDFRNEILSGRTATGADAPLIRTFFYMLLNEIAMKNSLSASDKLKLDAWNDILLAAAEIE